MSKKTVRPIQELKAEGSESTSKPLSSELSGEALLTISKALVLFKRKTKKRYGSKPKKESPEKRQERLEKGMNKETSPKKLKQKKKEKKNKTEKDLTDEHRVAKPTANEEVKEEELKKDLHVAKTDFKIMQNAFQHYTNKYKCVTRKEDKDLVLRRGFTFNMEVEFDRPIDFKHHFMAIMMSTGSNPDMANETFAMMEVTETGTPGDKQGPMIWWTNVKKQEGKCLELEVHIPANCIIGHWRMTICTTDPSESTSDNAMLMFEDPMDIIVLFNAWCKDDDVYFPETKLLDEYILNPDGIQFTGDRNLWYAKPWRFGQFADGILDTCLDILLKAFNGRISKKMRDPVKVSRKMSKIINDCDDSGVLEGNWTGKYEGGTNPSSWKGSVKILQEFDRNNGKPVQFGQCWVFSGVTTTMSRAFGIPARSLTNYSSAHDTDSTIHIDRFWKKEGNTYKKSDSTTDSTWNFHVWNEVWMARRDLPEGYDGWQAIDSTPQETSDDVFCCGPSPLAAIRKGECHIKYDTMFLFSEVNADLIDWELDDKGEKTKLVTNKHTIGVNMSTKEADGKPYKGSLVRPSRDVLTNFYKYPEGTEENRKAIQEARKSVLKYHDDSDMPAQQLEMKLSDIDTIMMGSDFSVKVYLKSIAKDGNVTTIKELQVELVTKRYTGETMSVVKTESFKDVVLKPGEEIVKEMQVKAADHINVFAQSSNMEVTAFARVEETGRTQLMKDEFIIDRPQMDVRGPWEVFEGENITVELSLKNPLPVPLTAVQYDVESSEFVNAENCKHPDIPANGEWKTSVTLKADPDAYSGDTCIYTNFESNELSDISGLMYTTIRP